MNENPEFSLQSANATRLLTLQEAADSCGVTRQAFHGWGVRPERVEGNVKLFSLSAILDNRTKAIRQARSPAESDRERLEARLALLRAQIERERVLCDQASARYAPRSAAQEAVRNALAGAIDVLTDLPGALLEHMPKLEQIRPAIEKDVQRAIEPLSSRLDDAGFEPAEDQAADRG